jgi:DNA-binding XRE family transcriptional regulator
MKKQKYLRGLFGTELIRQRKAVGLSAAELAATIGVSINTVYRWENKRSLPNPRAWSALVEWSRVNCQDYDALSRAYTYCSIDIVEDRGESDV